MKPRLQTSLGQHLVLTPQLRQALHLLQLSTVELETEITTAVESNPLLDWEEPESISAQPLSERGNTQDQDNTRQDHDDNGRDGDVEPTAAWDGDDGWNERGSGGGQGHGDNDGDGDAADRMIQSESLQDHLSWQLHLSTMSTRDRNIGIALIDAIDDDGYLRESLDDIVAALLPETRATAGEVAAVLCRVQRFDPVGVGARDLGECLRLQLEPLRVDTPGRSVALLAARDHIERLPKLGAPGLADALGCPPEEAATALQLLRSLDPRPGAQIGNVPHDNYVTPDCVIARQNGVWKVTLAGSHFPRVTIHRGYEQMIQHAGASDAGYLKGRLQEARWLLKNIEARGETLLKVVRCLVRQQSGFLEFGKRALRPLTLREVAEEIGMHESTVSRAVARKWVHTPRGTLSLKDFFDSGVGTEGGGEASSTAIQQMIRSLIEAENPRKPLSDARLADLLKAAGVPVARRTVAKYREALHIVSSHERVRIA
ncbi:RNA polymerase factor sigma-54 [Luteimonas fraxinea]|uniref:RNA polymerase sigma-54 factor n=1 Tax=Luteimonas fraxinea TaxID=2901869 RepID=A0ABS8UG89_9GAMM|nr:RNA polymerase factor sigma-54 [Luteimonas fraxinea]MCD9097910.1 RNA polymerase factor sigma-54 [Luteimonas fraxinea]UHH09355.1 RNA polymerase factor sigma-54 [Luteimonas fraxinea]